MKQPTLLQAPDNWNDRVNYLVNTYHIKPEQANLLLQVELAFWLMETLNLSDEPISAVWAVLSKSPMAESRLMNLSPEKRRSWANASQLVPFPEKFNWLNALRDYQLIPSAIRMYDVSETDFDAQIIAAAKKDPVHREAHHEHLYATWLSQQLPFRERNVNAYASQVGSYEGAGQVSIDAGGKQLQSEQRTVLFNLGPEAVACRQSTGRLPTPGPRTPFNVDLSVLSSLAGFLDEREAYLAQRIPIRPRNWCRRLAALRYQSVDQEGHTHPASAFFIEGFTHLAGMVASGKSTLSQLLAAHIIKDHPNKRITLVVSDVQSAIQLANQINEWFCDDPNTDAPVAVPIFGRSSLHTHMQGFYKSATYLSYRQRGAFHWGERWLNPLCPLQQHVSDSDWVNVLQSGSFVPGTEPCQQLRFSKEGRVSDNNQSTDKPKKQKRPKRACPYLPVCPQYQLYRDLPNARVWVTTPGGLSSGTLPRQFDRRAIHVGELVYEQSDVVVFDEVDTLINWFDNQFATVVTLTNGSDGVFDEIAAK